MNILKNKSEINTIFESGKSVSNGVILLKFLESNESGLVFAVSSKKFKRAVDRNRIKRLMKESTRVLPLVNKNVAVVFIGNEVPSFSDVNNSIKYLFNKL